ATKYHLCVGLAVYLAAGRRWRAMAGAAAGVAAELAASFMLEGPRWVHAYLGALGKSNADLGGFLMPNLRGISSRLPFSPAFEIALSLVALAALWVIVKRSDVHRGIAFALLAGLLVGHHSYTYDVSLALPAVMVSWREGQLAR